MKDQKENSNRNGGRHGFSYSINTKRGTVDDPGTNPKMWPMRPRATRDNETDSGRLHTLHTPLAIPHHCWLGRVTNRSDPAIRETRSHWFTVLQVAFHVSSGRLAYDRWFYDAAAEYYENPALGTATRHRVSTRLTRATSPNVYGQRCLRSPLI